MRVISPLVFTVGGVGVLFFPFMILYLDWPSWWTCSVGIGLSPLDFVIFSLR